VLTLAVTDPALLLELDELELLEDRLLDDELEELLELRLELELLELDTGAAELTAGGGVVPPPPPPPPPQAVRNTMRGILKS
jgi:hypothetical protein